LSLIHEGPDVATAYIGCTKMRRLPLSRLISFNPSENPKFATCRSGTDAWWEPLTSGSMTGSAPNASRSLRWASGTRTTIW
jgi:hypothetical protein